MPIIRLFLQSWKENFFFSFKNLLCFCFIATILFSNFYLASHLPTQIELLGLENHSMYFSPLLFLLSNLSLIAICGFCLSLKQPFDLISLAIFSLFSLCIGLARFASPYGTDLSFLQTHISFWGHLLPTQFYIFSLYFLGTLLLIAIFLPFTGTEPPSKKRFLSLPFLMLFLSIMAAQSYRFRHIEINQFLTEKTGLIASFAGKDGALRFLYPHPHQDITQWQAYPKANLRTENAGQRTALLVRREFSGIIGECLGFLLVQLSSEKKIL